MAALGTTSDPKELIPGVPDSIEADIAALRDRKTTVESVGQDLERVDTGTWTGPANQAFLDTFALEPPKWFRTCDLLDSSATALEDYVDTLRWAQSQASEAIRLWEQGEQATAQAKASHEAAVAEAQAAAGDAPGQPVPPFSDPGEELRQQARELLDRARTQLREAGDAAVAQIAGPGKQGDGQGWLAEVGSYLAGVFSAGNLTMSGKAEANGPNAGWEGTAPSLADLSLGSIKAHANLADASAQGKLSYAGIDMSGKAGASIGAQGTAAAGLTSTGLSANASGSVGARASASGKATYGIVDVAGKADAFAGAEAGAGANIGRNGVDLNASAFAGAKAGAGISGDVAGIGAGVNGEVWAGVGAEADATFEMDNGKITIGGHVGAALGVGGSFGGEITIDTAEVAGAVGDAAGAVGDAADAVTDLAGW